MYARFKITAKFGHTSLMFSDILEAGMIAGNYMACVDWTFQRLGSRILKMFIKNCGRLLYAACYCGDPKAVEWALNVFHRSGVIIE